eukprot:gene22421-biopygen7999
MARHGSVHSVPEPHLDGMSVHNSPAQEEIFHEIEWHFEFNCFALCSVGAESAVSIWTADNHWVLHAIIPLKIRLT